MNQKPLTAQDLAEALGCFSNAAIGAMHNGTHIIGCIAQGIDAVVWRLQELAESGQPTLAPPVASPADTTDPVMAAFHSPRLGNGAVPYAPIEEV